VVQEPQEQGQAAERGDLSPARAAELSSAERRARLGRARLYFVAEADALDAVRAALAAGADMVQLRDKEADDQSLLETLAEWRGLCDEHGALLWLNDRPDLAAEAGADGVHVGQADLPVAAVRTQVGPDMLIGLSTHSPAQFDAALDSEADQLSVGPVWETPTKEGRPAAGLDYVRHAAAHAFGVPWFAIGGIDLDNVRDVLAAGAQRIVVVRAIRDAADPGAAAAAFKAALDEASPGGTGQ
jgi:thiamine-phosphate pyrophosphorylase